MVIYKVQLNIDDEGLTSLKREYEVKNGAKGSTS